MLVNTLAVVIGSLEGRWRRWQNLPIVEIPIRNRGVQLFSGTHAFLWSSTSGFQDLGTLGGRSSIAMGINDVGQVVGSSDVP